MEFLFYILAGAFVGWIASMIAGTNREQGAIANIIVGILGAFLGSFLVRAIGGSGVTGFDITSFPHIPHFLARQSTTGCLVFCLLPGFNRVGVY
jgi:uncharacterized membrane protein YeaQ/YmgE (transglycosylase-associated protein family)